MKLSIIIPVFNEEETIEKTIEKVKNIQLESVIKEIIVVDDGSTDKTADSIKKFVKNKKDFYLVQHKKNRGKGAAVQTGIKAATGDYILIQDADLEYDPKYIPLLLAPILSGKTEVVYGTRLNRLPNIRREERTLRFFIHYLGNRLLSFIVSILHKIWLTDIETGYKLFPKKVFDKMKLERNGFDFEAEITIKLLKNGYKILEIPITTNPRGYTQGKKLNTVYDGIAAVKTIFHHSFI